jgi:hypothetical protein
VIRLSFAFVTTVGILVLPGGDRVGAAQQRGFRAALQARLLWMDIEYGDQRIQGQGVVLRGEPLVLDIGVVNHYQGPAAMAEIDWPQRIFGSVRRGGRFDAGANVLLPLQCNPKTIRESDVRVVGNHLELGQSGFQFVRCQIDSASYEFTGGTQTVTVEWSNGPDMQPFREKDPHVGAIHPLSSVIEFEFREVVTPEDGLDLQNHLASHAYLEGNLELGLQLVQRVLTQRPLSTTALMVRGRIRAAQGACKQAAADWEQLATIIEGESDVGNRANARLGLDQRQVAAAKWREQARALKCR